MRTISIWLLILTSLISEYIIYQPLVTDALIIKRPASIYARDTSVSSKTVILPEASSSSSSSSSSSLSLESLASYSESTGENSHQKEEDESRRTKFLILTTGDQIKLYPLARNQDVKQYIRNEQVNLENRYYLIKPIALNISHNSQQLVEQFGNNSFTRWNIYKAQRSQNLAPRKISILPRSIDSDEDYSSAEHGWKKPWIVDVDYFFDAAFCPTLDLNRPQINKCLVVVWLDKSNKYVRYGSIDLRRNPIDKILYRSRSHSTNSKNKILWLTEFPPIDLNQYAIYNSTTGLQVFAMVIDKQRSRIHISFSDGRRRYANMLLSGKLTALPEDRTHNQLNDVELLRINECLDHFPESSLTNTSFRNLNVDEDNGNWLFYFDQHGGGKIFALQTSRWSYERRRDSDSSSRALQALVRDISIDKFSQLRAGGSDNKGVNSNVTGMAMDPAKRRLYWLNEASELFSSDYAGYDVRMVGKLTHKPVIRSLGSMQVFQDTLLLSDPIKRTLIAYTLPKDDNTLELGDSDIGDVNRQLQIRPTHQVLLVETPALFGFRVFDTESLTSLVSEDRVDGLETIAGSIEDLPIEELSSESSRLGFTLDSFLGRSGSWGQKNEYSLLLRRVNDSSQCGYRSQLLSGRTTYCLDDRLFFIFEVAAVQIAFCLWCFFCWYKRRSIGETKLVEKCPV